MKRLLFLLSGAVLILGGCTRSTQDSPVDRVVGETETRDSSASASADQKKEDEETTPSFDPSAVTLKEVSAPVASFGNPATIVIDEQEETLRFSVETGEVVAPLARSLAKESISEQAETIPVLCLLTHGVRALIDNDRFVMRFPFDYKGILLDCSAMGVRVDEALKLHRDDLPEPVALTPEAPLHDYFGQKVREQAQAVVTMSVDAVAQGMETVQCGDVAVPVEEARAHPGKCVREFIRLEHEESKKARSGE